MIRVIWKWSVEEQTWNRVGWLLQEPRDMS